MQQHVCSRLPLAIYNANTMNITQRALCRSGRCRACHQQYNKAYHGSKLKVLEPTVQYKACSACGEAKPAVTFRKDTASADGLGKQCRDCANTKEAERRTHDVAPSVSEKQCGKCNQVKPVEDFHLHRRCKGGQ